MEWSSVRVFYPLSYDISDIVQTVINGDLPKWIYFSYGIAFASHLSVVRFLITATFRQLTRWGGACEEFVRATSHSTIFDIPMRPVREDQRH